MIFPVAATERRGRGTALQTALGSLYSHPSTSYLSKKYSILVINILPSMSISPTLIFALYSPSVPTTIYFIQPSPTNISFLVTFSTVFILFLSFCFLLFLFLFFASRFLLPFFLPPAVSPLSLRHISFLSLFFIYLFFTPLLFFSIPTPREKSRDLARPRSPTLGSSASDPLLSLSGTDDGGSMANLRVPPLPSPPPTHAAARVDPWRASPCLPFLSLPPCAARVDPWRATACCSRGGGGYCCWRLARGGE